MIANDFASEFADVIEIAPAEIHESFDLGEHGWDSLAILSTIALIDEHYGKTVDTKALGACRTFGELQALIQGG